MRARNNSGRVILHDTHTHTQHICDAHKHTQHIAENVDYYRVLFVSVRVLIICKIHTNQNMHITLDADSYQRTSQFMCTLTRTTPAQTDEMFRTHDEIRMIHFHPLINGYCSADGYTHICTYIYVHIHAKVCVNKYVYIYIYMCMYKYECIYIYIYIYMYIHVSICIYICKYVYLYKYVYAYFYKYKCIHTYVNV